MARADRSHPHSPWPELACVFPGRSRRPRARLVPPVPELALVELGGGPVGDRHSRAGLPCRTSPVPGLARAATLAPLLVAPTCTGAWPGWAPPTLVGIASPGLAWPGGAHVRPPTPAPELAVGPGGACRRTCRSSPGWTSQPRRGASPHGIDGLSLSRRHGGALGRSGWRRDKDANSE
jgi:hypothetical protein